MGLQVLTETKVDAPRRTDAGAKMWCCPSYVGGTPTVLNPDGCQGCAKQSAHNVAENILIDVPVGQSGGRYGMIPRAERQDVGNMHRLGAALWLWSYYLQGMPGGDIVFNAGEAGDNATQTWRYEIVSGGAGQMVLRGRNPKYLIAGGTRLNPDWPLPDPVTGETGRIITMGVAGALTPVGAAVEFEYPSVLWKKVYPLITRLEMPESDDEEDVEFTVYFDDGFNARNAKKPYDLQYPPADGKYYCVVRIEFLRPQTYRDYQAPREMLVSPRSVVLSTAEVHELLDSEGGHTRVLFPSMAGNAFRVTFDPAQPFDSARLSTERVDGHYESVIDLTGLTFATCTVDYWAESTASDTVRVPVIGECSRSKTDPTGSYAHDGDEHCALVSSSGFVNGEYHEHCWLPGRCNGFILIDESIVTMGDHQHLSNLWTRAGWIVEQQVVGVSSTRNFTLHQRGGASVEGLCGSFCDEVPSGLHQSRWELAGRQLGRRITYEDEEGTHHALVHGAFYLENYDYGDETYTFDAHAAAELGVIASEVDGWTTGKAFPGNPWRYVGNTSVSSYSSGGSSMAAVNTPTTGSESYLVAVDVGAVADSREVLRVREIYGG